MKAGTGLRMIISRSAGRQKGMVMVVVLWILVLLAVIVSSYLSTIRTDTAIIDNWRTTAQSRWAAHAGVQIALLKLIEKSNQRWTGNTVHRLPYQGSQLNIVITDEAGKVDINQASAELLQVLFHSSGLSTEQSDDLVASMMKYRETIGRKEDGGFGKFQNSEEITRVRGMRPDVMHAIQPLITAHSGMNGINPDVASKAALSLLPGMEPAEIEKFIQTRLAENVRLDNLLGGVSRDLLHRSRGYALNINVEAEMPDGYRGMTSVIVKLDERRRAKKKPFKIMEWNETTFISGERESQSTSRGVM